MGIMDAVKKGFSAANSLIKIIGIFFIFNVIVSVLSVPLTNPARAGEPLTMALSVISSIIFFLIFIFLQGGALGIVKDKLKTANVNLSRFLDYGKKYYLRILGLLVVYIIIAILVVLILGLISAGILLLGDNTFTRLIVVVLVAASSLGIITLLIYPIYAIVADDIGPIAAFKKGIMTSISNFWKTLGLFLVLLLISLGISFIIGALIGVLTIPTGPVISQYIIAVVNAAVQSYIPVVMMISFMGMFLSFSSGAVRQDQPDLSEGQSV